jgi:hypothetical protein
MPFARLPGYRQIAKKLIRHSMIRGEHYKAADVRNFLIDEEDYAVVIAKFFGPLSEVEKRTARRRIHDYLLDSGFIDAKGFISSKGMDFATATWLDEHQFWFGIILAGLLSLMAAILQPAVAYYFFSGR